MKVVYDHQIFTNQVYGGISRYFTDLMDYYAKNELLEFGLALKHTENHYLKTSDHFKDKLNFPNNKKIDDLFGGKNFKGKGKIFKVYNKLFNINIWKENRKESIRVLQSGNFDVFHPTYFDTYFLDYLASKPYVITVYDMIHEIYPEYVGAAEPIWTAKKEIIQKASKVIAISKSTKNDIIEFCHIDPDKIEVIYLHSTFGLEQVENKAKGGIPSKYVLFVGNRHLYKNFYFFATVMAAVMRQDESIHLVCAGGGNFTKFDLDFLDYLEIRGKTHYYGADNKTLMNLYANAQLFVLPSLYEGFGIPVLEAFNCDCPVACSNKSSLPEVAGEAASYFEPKDYGSMKLAIEKVLNDSKYRTSLIEKGKEQRAKFSLRKTAETTKSLYESIL